MNLEGLTALLSKIEGVTSTEFGASSGTIKVSHQHMRDHERICSDIDRVLRRHDALNSVTVEVTGRVASMKSPGVQEVERRVRSIEMVPAMFTDETCSDIARRLREEARGCRSSGLHRHADLSEAIARFLDPASWSQAPLSHICKHCGAYCPDAAPDLCAPCYAKGLR